MVTVAFDAMRVCMGMKAIHHDPEVLGRFIVRMAYLAIPDEGFK